jgi:hypothetical protein
MRRVTEVFRAPRAPKEHSDPQAPADAEPMAGPPARRRLRARTRILAASATIALMAMLAPAVAEAANGEIFGTVTSHRTKSGIDGAQVCATPKGGGAEKCTEANSNGEYEIKELAPGKYELDFTGIVCYDDGFCFEQVYVEKVVAVEVKSAESTEVNAELTELDGSISGRVTAGGSPLANIEVCSEYYECATTNSNGEYTIEYLPPGSHKVSFFPKEECKIICEPGANYLTLWWNNQTSYESANTVTVESEETKTGINAEMQVGGEISGKATTASATPQAIGNLEVCDTSTATNKEGEREYEEGCTLTNSSGEYTIRALGAHGYEVDFTGRVCVEENKKVKCTNPYVTQYYSGIVSVTPPATVSGINASLLEVTSAKPANTAAPTVTGSTSVGGVLSCSQGSWTNNPASFTYKWLRNGTVIAGQTGSTYTVESGDVGTAISCEVTATNAAGSTGAVSSTLQLAPGVAVFVKIKIKGSTVSITLRCTGANTCTGVLKLLGRVVKHKHASNTTIATTASFTIAAGGSETLSVHLTGQGHKLLAKAGKKGLTVQISGTGVKVQKSVLKK